jgi:hypothetical protein
MVITQQETWGKRRRGGIRDEIKNGHEYNEHQAGKYEGCKMATTCNISGRQGSGNMHEQLGRCIPSIPHDMS